MGIWEEVGLEDATNREKAAFWRENLEEELEDLPVMGLTRALGPVLVDVRDVVDPEDRRKLIAGPRSSSWDLFIEAGEARHILREMKRQIRHASDTQIIGYAERYYRTFTSRSRDARRSRRRR